MQNHMDASTVLPKYIIIELFSSGQCKLH